MKFLVRYLRAFKGVNQEQMGAAAGLDRSSVSRYETGEVVPSRKVLIRLAAAAGLPISFVEKVLLPVMKMTRAAAESYAGAPPATEPAAEEETPTADLEDDLLEAARTAMDHFLTGLHGIEAPLTATPKRHEDRHSLPYLWARFEAARPEERRRLVETAPDYQTGAFIEKLCDESESAEPPSRALQMARLALTAAERATGPAATLSRLQAYAWAFVANALRLAGDLHAADAAFSIARDLWTDDPPPDPTPLSALRLDALEASLRRAQQRWPLL